MKITSLAELQAIKEKGLQQLYPDKLKVMVGMATCGISAGADKVFQTLAGHIAKRGWDVVLTKTGCIGYCQREPLVDVVYPGKVRLSYQEMNPERAEELAMALQEGQMLEKYLMCRIDQEEILIEGATRPYANPHPPELPVEIPRYEELPFFRKQVKISLRNCGFINPEQIEEYIARGGYRALHQALSGMTPEEIIAQVKASGLRGRGGAGFPTGLKWEFCRNSPGGKKYVICNADEGDPGAFMDRGILEGDPHAVIEGMAIGAYAMGADEGYIYCRAEYPLAIARLKIAIAQAEEYGLLGENIFGTDFSFRLKIREGAGAFVCGEETALIASIEGRVGEPQPRPPFPAQSGLWGPAHQHQQCQDLVPYRPHHRSGRRLVRSSLGTEKQQRHHGLFPGGEGEKLRSGGSAPGHYLAGDDLRVGGWHCGGPALQGGADRRAFRPAASPPENSWTRRWIMNPWRPWVPLWAPAA